jgi:hypothetical protein
LGDSVVERVPFGREITESPNQPMAILLATPQETTMHFLRTPIGYNGLTRRLLCLCLWFGCWMIWCASPAVAASADHAPGQLTTPATAIPAMPALQAVTPALQIPATPQIMSQNRIDVPVLFTSNGQSIAAVGFALDYQESCLLFDATDSDGDGLPDAITGVPVDFAVTIAHHPTQSSAELEVAIYDAALPMHTLSDGLLLTVQFIVKVACRPTAGAPINVTINFAANPAVSFGDVTSQDLAGTATGATIALAVNSPPTALILSNQTITESSPISTVVGLLSTTDPDSGDSHSYTMTIGVGSTDNGIFFIDGALLRSASVFDYETKASYSIRVRTTDSNGLSLDQRFVITITDVNEIPVAVADPIDPRSRIFIGGQTSALDVLANDSTPIGVLRVLSVTQPAVGGGLVVNNSATISYTAPNANGSATFRYTATNGYGNSTPVTVSLHYVANQARGDCNGNGAIGAGDFVGVTLEIFDTNDSPYNGAPAWWLVHTGDYPGSPLGCDANASANGLDQSSDSITAADLICTVLLFFGHPCGSGIQAAGVGNGASLRATVVNQGGETTIPLILASGGQAVAAVAFALNLGDAPFDATDANGDGLPDTVAVTIPAGFSQSVRWNGAAQRLEVALYGSSLPMPTLQDGVLATVMVDGVATPTLTQVSLSDADGNDLLAPTRIGIFLPLIVR